MIKRILVPLDGSNLAESAVPHAIAVARAFDADVELFQVIESRSEATSLVDSVEWRLNWAEASAYLDALAERVGGSVTTTLADGRAPEQIVQHIQRERIDLTVMATHGRGGPSEFRLSSTVHKVISAACGSLLVVPAVEEVDLEPEGARYARLLVPLDCSTRGDWALPVAVQLAREHQAELWLTHIMPATPTSHAIPLTESERQLEQRLAEARRARVVEFLEREAAPLAATELVVKTHLGSSVRVAETLDELADQKAIDLIILTAHGLSGSTSRPHGSVASALLEFGSHPILILQDIPRTQFTLRRLARSRARSGQHAVG